LLDQPAAAPRPRHLLDELAPLAQVFVKRGLVRATKVKQRDTVTRCQLD